MAVPPSSFRPSSSPLPSLLRSPPLFTPIQEVEREEDDEEAEPKERTAAGTYHHEPTPLHTSKAAVLPSTNASRPAAGGSREDLSVSCSKCRPSSRDKISVVPLDTNGTKRSFSNPGPTANGLLRSIIGSLARKSPLHATSTPSSSAAAGESSGEWQLAAAELSRKLLHATRKRDEAVLEASRLKHSMSELERKLDRLEFNCRDLHATLERCARWPGPVLAEPFVVAAADARTAVRNLSRYLFAQLRAVPRSLDRVAALFNNSRKNRKNLLIGMESLLNRVFYSEFERACEGEGMLPDPKARCAANRAAYEVVRVLGWEEVLSKGTRHYSEGLSRFCDRRMSEVVDLLGWARAWSETLLQAFFGAARGVWAVHLLARSVHPPLPILRVDRRAQFDSAYMEEAEAGRRGTGAQLLPGVVIMMVAPGFYVYDAGCNVIKCRVLAEFGDTSGGECSNDDPRKARVEDEIF